MNAIAESTRFLHIPKTAGISLGWVLRDQYRWKNRFELTGVFDRDARRFRNLTEKRRNNIRLCFGHAPFITGIPELDSLKIITVLRDPIRRVKSMCEHVYEGKSVQLRRQFPPGAFGVSELLKSGYTELSNLQAKMLISRGATSSSDLTASMSAASARDLALENLFTGISAFGLTEYLKESILMFASELNWRLPITLPVLNKSRSSHKLTYRQSDLERISELNAIDIEIYETAKKRFISIMPAWNVEPVVRMESDLNCSFSIPIKYRYASQRMLEQLLLR